MHDTDILHDAYTYDGTSSQVEPFPSIYRSVSMSMLHVKLDEITMLAYQLLQRVFQQNVSRAFKKQSVRGHHTCIRSYAPLCISSYYVPGTKSETPTQHNTNLVHDARMLYSPFHTTTTMPIACSEIPFYVNLPKQMYVTTQTVLCQPKRQCLMHKRNVC